MTVVQEMNSQLGCFLLIVSGLVTFDGFAMIRTSVDGLREKQSFQDSCHVFPVRESAEHHVSIQVHVFILTSKHAEKSHELFRDNFCLSVLSVSTHRPQQA